MAVKIELEKSEILQIRCALIYTIASKDRIIKTGKLGTHKVNKIGIEATKKEKKDLEKLDKFFEGLEKK